MLKKKINQEHVPMAVTENRHQSETENVLVSTTAIVETTNTKNKKNERANWSNRIVYLLSIIGFVVDLGKIFFNYKFEFFVDFSHRERLAFSNNMLSKWRWCLSPSLFYFLIPCWSSM